ncbi:MAG: N-succinylarginine dihydrolase [Kordiimonadaceae bacterium]|nr:N-succinylarginine dihydrolase [Kordiimonadaceae bacterium]
MADNLNATREKWQEVNFDGLVGATHNYAGLSYGNVASAKHSGMVANPREGALQGLQKMQHLRSLGLMQGVLPPHDRPHISTLRALGYTGSDAEILTSAYRSNPELVSNVSSSATMWTANAATITPSPDAADGKMHFTPANLAAMYHRSLEAPTTARVLKAMFPEGDRFAHHDPIAGGIHMGDEGAANHNRFCTDYGEQGVSLFVYGRGAFEKTSHLTYPGRQCKESCLGIFAQHGVAPERMLLERQNPAAINAGAFHNDVVAVSNKTVFFYHEEAFLNPADLEQAIQRAMIGAEMQFIKVLSSDVPLADAVSSYLFNSQLVSVPGRDGMTLILPVEVEETPTAKAYVDSMVANGGPIARSEYMDVRESMRNGGGPACLRLRVAMSDSDIQAMGANCIITDALLETLQGWVKKHYRDRVLPEDLGDVALMEENFTALDELTQLLKLGSVYDFQR